MSPPGRPKGEYRSAQREGEPISPPGRPKGEYRSAQRDANPSNQSAMRILQPDGWAPPKGYANGIAARGTVVFVGGQIGWNAQQQFETDDFAAQARQALANVVAILREAGAGPEHITRMTWYVVDKREYASSARALGVAYREIIGRHFPAMTAVAVAGLIEDRARVEIEVTAVVPDPVSRA